MQKNLQQSFIERMPVLLVIQRVIVSEPPFMRGLKGNVFDSSLAIWKARSRLPIGYNCTCLLALTADALMRRYWPFSKGRVTLGLNIRLKGHVYRRHL